MRDRNRDGKGVIRHGSPPTGRRRWFPETSRSWTAPDRGGESENLCHPRPAHPPGAGRRGCAAENPRIFASPLSRVRRPTFRSKLELLDCIGMTLTPKGQPGSPVANTNFGTYITANRVSSPTTGKGGGTQKRRILWNRLQ